ncbi:hypothetical protein E7V67_013185 [[Empedobacter] haloabium]|uniref:Lysine transporter LysE n=1 Tax=[Empedobacter] haloabium TaxID=592317 RepID=A0ABZ1UTJ8_9BURK
MSPALLLLLLLAPVGVNRLLRRSGAGAGLVRTLPLLAAGWLACCLAIGTWCTVSGLLALAGTAARPAAQLGAAAYLLWRLLARERQEPNPRMWSLFPAALVDPVAICCAVFVFPVLGTPAPQVLAAYGWFTALMVPAGLGWAAVGAGLPPRRMALRRPQRRAALLAAGAARVR